MDDSRHAFTRYIQPARTVFTTLAATLLAASAAADPASLLAAEPAVWSPTGVADKDHFGTAVAIDGQRMAVGATGVDKPKDGAGAVYLYERSGTEWQQAAALQLGNDIGVQTQLGAAVALEGDWLAAGAPGVYAGEGAVFLYGRDGNEWQQEHRFLPPGSQDFTGLGSNLDMDNGRLIAGVPGFDGDAKDSGMVLLYELTDGDEWVASGQLQPDAPGEGERFGSDVALHGNLALVGAHGVSAAYLFEQRDDQWVQVARFSEAVGELRGNFGDSVALAGNTLLIGAPFADTEKGERQGAAFLYTREGDDWALQATLHSDNPNRGDQFGRGVALRDGMALVTSPRDDADERDAGAVLVFGRGDGDWTIKGRLARPEPASYDEFGRALAMDAESGTVLVGTPSDAVTDEEAYTGSVAAYRW